MANDDFAQPRPQPQQPQILLDRADLMQAFEAQQQRLEEFMQKEYNSRLPLATGTDPASSKGAKQTSSLWFTRSFLSGCEHRSDKDQHVIDTLLANNYNLRHEINNLQKGINTLQATNASLRQDNHYLKTQYDSTRSELDKEQKKSAELESKWQTFRSKLIPTNDYQVSDSEVVSKFTSLRSQIHRLVKTTWCRDAFKNGVKLAEIEESFPVLRQFIEEKVEVKYLDDLLRGRVFDSLYRHIFSARVYALDENFADLDTALSHVEDLMWKKLPAGHTASSIIDMRNAAMKATRDFRNDRYRQARIAHHNIWNFFKIFETRSDKSAVEGKQMLEKICMDAVDLVLMMRHAKDEYQVDWAISPFEQPISKFEEIIEEEASQPARSHDPETIAYLITGALSKYPKGETNDKRVLEKAQAVVYR